MEFDCPKCRQTVLARREARFDGLRKTGDVWICTACGHARDATVPIPPAENTRLQGIFGDEAQPARPAIFSDEDRPTRPAIFTADDRPDKPALFDASERRRSCGWCRHFVVNPFSQRCGLHNRVVDATDLCSDFAPKPDA